MLFKLLEFNNQIEANKLVITTHSPYLINYLALAVKAEMLKEQIKETKLKEKLSTIVPLSATVKPADVSIYQLNEEQGTIEKLESYDDIPSDENYLNEKLGESNEHFAQLLEIQQML